MSSASSLRELVQQSSPEEKDAVMGELLKQALLLDPARQIIPLADSDGVEVGYFISSESARQLSEKAWNDFPLSIRDTLGRDVHDIETTFSGEQLKTRLRQAAQKQC